MAKTRLSPERYRELLKAERDLVDILPDIDDLEACGEDCQAYRDIHRESIDRIGKLKQFFKPIGI